MSEVEVDNQVNQQEESQNLDEEIRKQFKGWYLQLILSQVVYSLFLVVFGLSFKGHRLLENDRGFLILLVYQVYQAIRKFREARTYLECLVRDSPDYGLQKSLFQLELGEKISFITALTFLVVNLLENIFNPLFTCLPLAISILIRYTIYLKSKSSHECFSLVDMVLVLVQFLCICLKIQGYVDWSWKETFWSFWIAMSVMIGICLGIFMIMVSKICQTLVGEVQSYEMYGMIFIFLMVVGYTVSSSILLIGIINKQEEPEDKKYLDLGIYSTVGVSGALLLLTLCGFESYLEFFEALVEEDFEGSFPSEVRRPNYRRQQRQQRQLEQQQQSRSDQNDQYQQQNVEPVRKKRLKLLKKSDILGGIPRYFVKQSSTYYIGTNREGRDNGRTAAKGQSEGTNQSRSPGGNYLNVGEMHSKGEEEESSGVQNTLGVMVAQQFEEIIIFDDSSESASSFPHPQKPIDRTHERKFASQKNTQREEIQFRPAFSERQDYSDKLNKRQVLGKTPKLQQIKQVEALYLHQTQLNTYRIKKGHNTHQQTRGDEDIVEEVLGGESMINSDISALRDNLIGGQLSEEVSRGGTQNLKAGNIGERNLVVSKHKTQVEVEDGSQNNTCLICFELESNSVFMPCGHGGVCYECSVQICKSTQMCYLCREVIKNIIQVEILKDEQNQTVYKVISNTFVEWE